MIDKNQSGVLSYVSNNSFIDGLIHSQMRKTILEHFDKIYILDLHGSSKKKESDIDGGKDENVFDIQQGVSINIFIKTSKKSDNEFAQVYHYDLYGKRTKKYQFLIENTLAEIKWKKLSVKTPYYFFVPKDFSGSRDYEKGFSVAELFKVYTSGVKTHHDNDLVSFDKFLEKNQKYNYRPFDIRYIEYDVKKVIRHRFDVMKHLLNNENICLCTCRQQSTYNFQHIFISTNISDICCVSSQAKEGAYIFPLYLYPEKNTLDTNEKRRPNLNIKIIDQISAITGLHYTTEKEQTPNTFAPIDMLDYIYAVLHSPNYREKYAEFLKIDFPRVPYPENADQFTKLAAFGATLRKYHLLDGVQPTYKMANYPVAGTNEIEKPEYKEGKVYINKNQYFDNVPQEAWNFFIGGYQPAQKWLKDRKGLSLKVDDIEHYQKIITALYKTHEIQAHIDGVWREDNND